MFGFLISALSALRSVPYKDVHSIVLKAGETAVGRRSSVPQLVNVGPSYPSSVLPSSMQCSNMGWDGSQYTWKCQAQLPDGVDLDRTDVTCEDWDPPVREAHEDDLMTAGSCGVEYALKGAVARVHPQVVYQQQDAHYEQVHHDYVVHENRNSHEFINVFIFIVILCVIVIFVSACIADCNRPRSTVHVTSPPPSSPPVYVAPASPAVAPVYVSTPTPTVHVTTSDSGPGFWSGWFLGSASRPHSSNTYVHHHHTTSPSSSWFSSSSSSSSGSSGSSVRSSSSSGGTHTSSSFSGTKRR